jgi:hypothetical protein
MSTTKPRYTTRSYGDRWYVDDTHGGIPFQTRVISAGVAGIKPGDAHDAPLSELEARTIAEALNAMHARGASAHICEHGVNRYYVDCGACEDYKSS